MKDLIYFIAGVTATKAEAAEIKKLGAKRIRNASMVKDADCLERCSKVAGSVPDKYVGVKGIEVLKPSTTKKTAKPSTKSSKEPESEDSLG